MVATLTTSGACILKAGSGLSTLLTSGANTQVWDNDWIPEVEAYVNNATRRNWIDDYSSLNTDVKLTLNEAVSSLVANKGIAYDMDGYGSTTKALTLLDVNADNANRCIKVLSDKNVEAFIDEET